VATVAYRRCVLERPIGQFRQRQTTWIPESLARVGAILQVRFNSTWDKNWELMYFVEEPAEAFDERYRLEWQLMPVAS
jgi:hypothetical protein